MPPHLHIHTLIGGEMLRKLSQLLIDLTVCNLDILFKNLRSKNRKEIGIILYFFLYLVIFVFTIFMLRFKQSTI